MLEFDQICNLAMWQDSPVAYEILEVSMDVFTKKHCTELDRLMYNFGSSPFKDSQLCAYAPDNWFEGKFICFY